MKAAVRSAFLASFALAFAIASCVEIAGVRQLSLDGPDGGHAAPPDVMIETDARSCVDVATDPLNCGICGHDCLGGTCAAGKCMPVELAFVESGGAAIAVDATDVYWSITKDSLGGVVRAVPKRGGEPRDIAARANIRTLATDDGALYMGSSSETAAVERCPQADCGRGAIVAFGSGAVLDLQIHGTDAFWRSPSGIERAPKLRVNGGRPIIVAQFPSGHRSNGFAVDDTGAYWTDAQNGTILRCPLTGCTPPVEDGGVVVIAPDDGGVAPDDGGVTPDDGGATIIAARDNAFALALGTNELFWTVNGPAGAIFRLNLGDGSATPLASDGHNPQSVLLDSKRIYWLTTEALSDRTIMACAREGKCEPLTLATSHDPPIGVAQDATALYWVTLGGHVQRLAK